MLTIDENFFIRMHRMLLITACIIMHCRDTLVANSVHMIQSQCGLVWLLFSRGFLERVKMLLLLLCALVLLLLLLWKSDQMHRNVAICIIIPEWR